MLSNVLTASLFTWIGGMMAAAVLGYAGEENVPIKATPERAGDQISVAKGKAGEVVLTVTSERGTGKAVLERVGKSWPTMRLQLRLKGLESLQIDNDMMILKAAISTQKPHRQTLSLVKKGKFPVRLDRKSPYWFDIRMLDGDGKAVRQIPLVDGGVFEMVLPAALTRDNPEQIRLQWVDFYRN